MVQTQTRRAAPRTGVALTSLAVFVFVLAVGAALYYEFGGPIPYYVHFSGPAGTSFEGRYALVDEAAAGLPRDAQVVRGSYPQTVTLWGPRTAALVAEVSTAGPQNVLSTLTVRRAGVICSEGYRWGTSASVTCPEP